MRNLRISKFEPTEGVDLLDNDLIRVNPNKPEYGSLMVIHATVGMSNGFMNKVNRVGFINGKVEDLQSLAVKEGANWNTVAGQECFIRVVEIDESELKDTDLGFQVKVNPSTGEELFAASGSRIMRRTYVEPIASGLTDSLVKHVSADELVEKAEEVAETGFEEKKTTK